MKIFLIIIISLFVSTKSVSAQNEVQIISLSGNVKVRYGLEEKWHRAAIGMILKDIDTILSGENGKVVIETANKKVFKLGSNAMIDIADLRRVLEKELFLYLMSKKVDKIEPANKTPLRIGNVSVVHGSLNKTDSSSIDSTYFAMYSAEKNGALALLFQEYYTNSIIKLHKIIDKYGSLVNEGEIYYYIAKGFVAINNSGQAIDAYEKSLNYFKTKKGNLDTLKIIEITKIIEELKK